METGARKNRKKTKRGKRMSFWSICKKCNTLTFGNFSRKCQKCFPSGKKQPRKTKPKPFGSIQQINKMPVKERHERIINNRRKKHDNITRPQN